MTDTLRIPAERFDPPPDLLLNAGETLQFLVSLQALPAVEAGYQVLANLATLSRSRLASADRLALLEAYRPAVERLHESLEVEFGVAGLPPTATAREALALCRDLAMELGYGYKILILDSPAAPGTGSLPRLVFRAMGALAQLLRSSYLTYTNVPEGTWLELHRLHARAEEAGVADAPVEGAQSVRALYTELLLVALTDPYRLNPGEVAHIPGLIRAEPGAAQLARIGPASKPEGHFIVDGDVDRPPLLAGGNDAGPPGTAQRSLDATALVARLGAQRHALEVELAHAAPASRQQAVARLELLRRLLVCWGNPPRRVDAREASDLQVGICVGLPTLAYLIGLESDPAPSPPPPGSLDPGVPAHAVSAWQVLNRSHGGLRLARPAGPLPHAVAVGEVVGIQFPGRGRWAVGVVRWLRRLENGGTEFGLQYLGNSAISVEIAVFDDENMGKVGAPLRSLVLDGEAAGTEPTLLATAGVFREARGLQIRSRGALYQARTLSLIEQGSGFELFRARRA